MNDPASPEYWRAADAEDEALDELLMQIRSQEDLGRISVREAAGKRVQALEDHLEVLRALRTATAPAAPQPQPQPQRPSCDPWSIVNTAIHDLARNGVKTHFGTEADLATAAGGAAMMLDALGVSPVVGDEDPLHPYTVLTAPVRRGLHECAECGGVGTAPTHRASCRLACEPS